MQQTSSKGVQEQLSLCEKDDPLVIVQKTKVWLY